MKVLTASLGCWLLLLWFSAAGAEEVKVNMLGLSRDSTVMIVSRGSNSKGTGFLIGDEHVMTCFHVVAELSAQSTSINWNVYPDLQVVLPSQRASGAPDQCGLRPFHQPVSPQGDRRKNTGRTTPRRRRCRDCVSQDSNAARP